MATIANLNVLLSANTAKFDAGMNKARKSLNQLSKSALSAKGMLAGFGVGFSGLALIKTLKDTADAIDKTAKVSDRLGIATEALLGLRHVANLSGVGIEEFDASLGKMTQTLGDATAGGGPAAKTLKNLGLSASNLASLAPEKAFGKISDAINKLPTPAQRAAAAVDIFGKSGANLLNTMSLGSSEIAKQAQELQKLGGSFTRIDAAKVELANDSLTKMGVALDGIKTQIAIGAAPSVLALSEAFIEAATQGDGFGPKVSASMETAANATALFGDELDVAYLAFKKLQLITTQGIRLGAGWITTSAKRNAAHGQRFRGPGAAAATAAAEHNDMLREELDRTIADLEKKLAKDWVGQGAGDRIKNRFGAINGRAQQMAEAIAKGAEDQRKAAAAAGPKASLDDFMKQGRNALLFLGGIQRNTDTILRDAIKDVLDDDPIRKFSTEFEKLNALFNMNKLKPEEYAKAIKKLKRELAGGFGIAGGDGTAMEQFQQRIADLQQLLKVGAINPAQFQIEGRGALADLKGNLGGPEEMERQRQELDQKLFDQQIRVATNPGIVANAQRELAQKQALLANERKFYAPFERSGAGMDPHLKEIQDEINQKSGALRDAVRMAGGDKNALAALQAQRAGLDPLGLAGAVLEKGTSAAMSAERGGTDPLTEISKQQLEEAQKIAASAGVIEQKIAQPAKFPPR